MKTLVLFSLCLLSLPAVGQSLFRLQRHQAFSPEPVRLEVPEQRSPLRKALAPLTVRANRDVSFIDATQPLGAGPVIRPLALPADLAARNPLYTTEIPIGQEEWYLVSGGYFMKERTARHAETVGLFRTWPIGNEMIGLVVKSGYPERYARP